MGVIAAGVVVPFDRAVVSAAVPAIGSVLFGVACGALALRLVPGQAAMVVLAAGGVRALGALGAGVWWWMAFEPGTPSFWGVFLAGAMAALVAEVVVVMRALRGGAGGNGAGGNGIGGRGEGR